MSEDELPEADRAEGAPHPRNTPRLFGQAEAEATFLNAVTEGRRHHAWLLTGPRGVGKATLAWRIARYLRTEETTGPGLFGEAPAPATLDIADDHPQSDPVLRADLGVLRAQLTAALMQLPPKLRAVVVLRDIYDLPHELIAEQLDISESAAKVRLHRARKRLRERLYPLGEEEAHAV